jgi:hypothetical protein
LLEATVRVALLLASYSERCNKYTQACLRVSNIKAYLVRTFLSHTCFKYGDWFQPSTATKEKKIM